MFLECINHDKLGHTGLGDKWRAAYWVWDCISVHWFHCGPNTVCPFNCKINSSCYETYIPSYVNIGRIFRFQPSVHSYFWLIFTNDLADSSVVNLHWGRWNYLLNTLLSKHQSCAGLYVHFCQHLTPWNIYKIRFHFNNSFCLVA